MAKDYRSLIWDYFSFILFILISTLLPLWSRIHGKKTQKSKADYVFATGGVSIIAMMLSIARGTLGIRSVLGYPSELFYKGSAMWEVIYGMVNAYPIVCFVFIPVYFNLGITSVYQYLDLRFKNRLIRCLASGTYIIRQILSLGITVYAPSIALSTVIGIPYWASIVGMSTICIIFTILGGLSAAINADVIQSVSVIFVTLVVIVQGMMDNGPKNVYDYSNDSGRLKFMNFTGDMTVRVDTLSAWLGQLFMSLSQFGCQQNFMQRYLSLRSLKEVTKVLMSNIPLIILFFSLSWIGGMVIYATYVNCDPLAAGYIQKTDEILPFYVEDRLSYIPGFLGIFMATLFNGALSLNVSNLNSLATVIWEDFLSQMPHFKGLSDKQQLVIIKTIAGLVGILITGIAFAVGLLNGVIESSMLAFSATSGPLLGVFILAMLIPVANWKGASAGMIVAHILTFWITFGGLTLDKPPVSNLETSTEGCSSFNFSEGISKPETSWLAAHTPLEATWAINSTFAPTTEAPQPEMTTLRFIYSISFMYYSLIGTALTVGIGIIVSYLTRTKDDQYDSKLLHPFIFKISEYIPGEKPYYIKSDKPVLEYDNPALSHSITNLEELKVSPEENCKSKIQAETQLNATIMDCNHWEAANGLYKKKIDGEAV